MIRNRARCAQIIDFSGLRFSGNIRPTDIDLFIDFGNRAFFLAELKSGKAPLELGQRLALERLCDGLQVPSLLAVAEHNTPIAHPVVAASASVRALRWSNSSWQPGVHGMCLLDAIWLLCEKIGVAA